jgi:organic radical activating enzyme
MQISEIFYAVQGEGLHRTPAVFVRFYGCNLRCRYNGECCDTPYAVYTDTSRTMSLEEVVQRIKSFRCRHIVFTGGEPTLYNDDIVKIIEALEVSKVLVEVETNGTIGVDENLIECVDLFNISLKLKSSNQLSPEYDKRRYNAEALKSFPVDKSIFKIVYCSREDLKELIELRSCFMIPIYLMPQGETREVLIKNISETLDACKQYDFGFSNRDHIIAYGNKRGV